MNMVAQLAALIGALIYIVLTRLWLEIVIQVFRITELLRDQNHMQRTAFSRSALEPATTPR